MTEPQPIETAPQDQWVLGWVPFISAWVPIRFDACYGRWHDFKGATSAPTYWLPLPPAPEEDTNG